MTDPLTPEEIAEIPACHIVELPPAYWPWSFLPDGRILLARPKEMTLDELYCNLQRQLNKRGDDVRWHS